MSLSGALTTMPLTDLLQWLGESRRGGLLSINFELEEYLLYLRDGEITAVETGDPRTLDVGQLCLAHGMLDDAGLERAHQEARTSGRPLSEILVENHLFSQPLLDEIRHAGANELVLNLFLQREGRFSFSPEQSSLLGDTPPVPLAKTIPLRMVLLEAMRRLDEWQRIVEVFPSDYCLVHALGRADNLPVLARLADRGEPMSIGELWAHRSADRYRVYEQLYEAFRNGLLAVDSTVTPSRGTGDAMTVDVLVRNGEILISEAQYDEAAAVLRSALNLDPFRADARDLLHRAREEQIASLYQTMPPYKVPQLRVPRERLPRLPLTPEERQVAMRINGHWDVGGLCVMLPIGEIATLRALRKLAHVGVITFEG